MKSSPLTSSTPFATATRCGYQRRAAHAFAGVHPAFGSHLPRASPRLCPVKGLLNKAPSRKSRLPAAFLPRSGSRQCRPLAPPFCPPAGAANKGAAGGEQPRGHANTGQAVGGGVAGARAAAAAAAAAAAVACLLPWIRRSVFRCDSRWMLPSASLACLTGHLLPPLPLPTHTVHCSCLTRALEASAPTPALTAPTHSPSRPPCSSSLRRRRRRRRTSAGRAAAAAAAWPARRA